MFISEPVGMAWLNSVLVAVTLDIWLFVASLPGDNVGLISFPVNITSLKLSIQDAMKDPLAGLRGALPDFAKNESDTCVNEGDECTAETYSCCTIPDYDLECLPSGESDVHICKRVQSSEELAQRRIDGLQYGDSKGMMNSHPWVDSWEFQSKSEMEKEEEQAAEDLEWKKNLNLSGTDENLWMKRYNKIKSGGEKLLHDLKKLNKVREIKGLIDKYLKHEQSNDELSVKSEEVTQSENPVEVHDETTPRVCHRNVVGNEETFSDYSWFYKDTKPSNTINESDSDESFIKFSNEIPKKDNNINFRIEDIIKDVTQLLSNKLKKNTEAKETAYHQDVQSPPSLQEPFHNNDVIDSIEELRKEIDELNKLKDQQNNEPQKSDQPDHDELIKKHVAAILEEERKLDKLKKLNEIKKLEQRA